MQPLMTALCFGTGSMAEFIVPAIRQEVLEIKAYIDERPFMRGTSYAGRPVIDFPQITEWSFDYILVACRPAKIISVRLHTLGIPEEKIVIMDVEKLLQEPEVLYPALLAYWRSFPGLTHAIAPSVLVDSPWLKAMLPVGLRHLLRVKFTKDDV